MTPIDNQPGAGGARSVAGAGSDVDRILDHNRLQLSALLDGELPLDEARFLLRRLEHDDELGRCWERWQLCGDVLRGQSGALLPSGFAQRVAAAVANDRGAATATATHRHRWLRWSGSAALAASVAVIALLLVRQSPDAAAPAVPTPQVATATPTPAAERPVATVPAPVVPDAPEKSPDQSAQLVSALAVADVPRRMSNRRSRGQSQRAAKRSPTRAPDEMPVAVAAGGAAPAAIDPFSNVTMPDSTLPNRPWPRALLPGAPANGAFTVDYGDHGTRSSFYPFAPRTAPFTPAQSERDLEELRSEQ